MAPPGVSGADDAESKKKQESDKYLYVSDAKFLFDLIGKEIQQIAHEAATDRGRRELHGHLEKATYPNDRNRERSTPKDPCKLKYEYHTNVTKNVIEPCKDKSEKRFSDAQGSECDNGKIRVSNGGACVPFRRLHMCDTNLQQIKTENITTHNLLADVCQAAKFEGQSIASYYAQYDEKYPGSGHTICTALARSFADIGDIIRGKDLYRGNSRRDKLETKLKEYFKIIYNKLEGSKNNYKSEEETGNFYQLREDWWEANRKTIWQAITCDAEGHKYFNQKACGGKYPTNDKCQCVADVPTYFDYVPQFLRWFEEWAEDFCRKRKKKLEEAITNCREETDEDGKKRYCDLNGYDCRKTAKGRNERFTHPECNKCSVACKPFVEWIDKEKEQFRKQKTKYDEEVGKADETNEMSNGKRNNIYEKHFYKIVKGNYPKVEKFLALLNKETICGRAPKKGEEEAGHVDFIQKDTDAIFAHTEYCQACPWCGLREKKDGKWERIDNIEECKHEEKKELKTKAKTDIEVLTPKKGEQNILKKYKTFCEKPKEHNQIKHWECQYEGTNRNNCVLHDENRNNEEQKDMSYDVFFYHSIIDMLMESIDWSKELKKCIKRAKTGKCESGCNKNCECYKRWVEKKKEEIDGIKQHFLKQEDMMKEIEGAKNSDVIFIYTLKDSFLNDIEEAYANKEQVQKIKELLEDINVEELEDTSNMKTIIDFMFEKEEKEAQECIKKQEECKKQQDDDRDARRSLPALPTPIADEPKNEDEEDDDEETVSDTEEALPDETEVVEETVAEGSPTKETTTPLNVCNIVKQLFEKEETNKFSDACKQKYGGNNKYLGWKCISDKSTRSEGGSQDSPVRARRSSDSTSSSSGGICVPPRRRKLYIEKIVDWAKTSGDTVSRDTQRDNNKEALDKLRDAFIKSAAIETFFLWDRCKKENKKTTDASLPGAAVSSVPMLGGGSLTDSEEKTDPDTELRSGVIPQDFLRQMFYTLGDYKDLFVGNIDSDVKNALKKSFIKPPGEEIKDKEAEKEDIMKQIDDKIQEHIKTYNPVTPPGLAQRQGQPSDTNPRSALWEQYAPDVWNGMVCALTYKEDTSGGENKIVKNGEVESSLLDKGKPKNNTDRGNDYTYEGVTIGGNDIEAMATTDDRHAHEGTPLKDFVGRPTFFRWLEEWGENFCKKRKEMLAKIRKECKVEDEEHKCGGDGESCEKVRNENYNNVRDFFCPNCGINCRFYKKWINRKKDQFEKQNHAYDQQKTNYEKECKGDGSNKDDKEFCGTLNTWPNAARFLERLKTGPCKNNTGSGQDNGESYIKFDDNDKDKTFGHEGYCDPCSKFKVNCENGNCKGHTNNICNGKNKTFITAQDIGKKKNSTDEVDMLVSDYSTTDIADDLKSSCGGAGIFKGIKKDVWKCGEYCGVHICDLKSVKEGTDGKEYIQIRALVKRWLEYFLEDYNRIQTKLRICINNGEETKCTNDCGKKCECVMKWVEEKKKEWPTIRDRFFKQYNVTESDVYPLTSFLEKLIPQSYLVNDKDKVIKLSKFDKSCGCSADANSQIKNGHKDAIDCMLKKLEKKIDKCKEKHNENGGTECSPPPPHTPLPDEDEEPLEEDEDDKKVEKPSFCKIEETKEDKVDEGGNCEESPGKSDVEKKKEKEKEDQENETKTEEENIDVSIPTSPTSNEATDNGNPEQTPVLKPEEEAPAPEVGRGGDERITEKPSVQPPPPRPQPAPGRLRPQKPVVTPLLQQPHVQTALLSSTLAWCIGIGITGLSYWWLLKRKAKPPVDLFSVLDIPKGDYGMPNLTSKNRYIPYSSGKHRGKRYIYIEGDSGTDSGYTDHYSDITSSSESEYEEIDLYVPHIPPKYKTLIEVVLEPSKRDTQNDKESDDTPSNKFTDNEWNELKDEFISNMLQSEQNTEPNNYIIGTIPLNTNTTSSHVSMDDKPFIMSIQDRNLLSGEEISYNINMNANNDDIPISGNLGLYSGIDLINDSLNSGNQPIDIYDEILKRKENELFGTKHRKHTSVHNFAKPPLDDPLLNQLELFHKWLDRHRYMCEKWDKNSDEKEELLDKLKEEWDKDNNKHSGIIHYSGKLSDIHSNNNKRSDVPYVLNTDVSIQIDMDNPKPTNEFSNMDANPNNSSMDSILDDMEKYNEPYYDIYEDDKPSVDDNIYVDHNNMEEPTEIQIEMDVNKNTIKEKYPISDVWDI
nr:erythrocyte membrane protein 1, PfEMP1, putative [Plasmodium sp. DRC-Itaito]